MHGRIYDPTIGRFMQADPFIQAPKFTQSFNRYSYVFNNPMSYTDPSGYIANPLKKLGRKVIRSASKVFGKDLVYSVGNAFATTYGGALGSAAWTYEFNRAHGASSSGALKGAFVAGVSSGIWSSDWYGGLTGLQQVGVDLALGYVGNQINGSGNSTTSSQKNKESTSNLIVRTVGRTSSSVTGNKFANGANSAAYAQMAGAVYSVNDFDIYNKGQLNIDGFLLDSIYTDETGMKAALFVRGKNEYVLSFAGTSSWSDWKANFVQGAGATSSQYESAKALAARIKRRYGDVHFVGHSLGGGLAALSALQNGATASIYNPAGLHINTIDGKFNCKRKKNHTWLSLLG